MPVNCLLIIHDGYGESQEVTFCRACLNKAFAKRPMTDDEIVIDSEDECEECGKEPGPVIRPVECYYDSDPGEPSEGPRFNGGDRLVVSTLSATRAKSW